MPHRALTLAAASSLCLLAGAPRAFGQFPSIPPDVQAIMTKLQQGQMPTAAEMQRMKQWGQQLKSGGVPTTSTPPSIPPMGGPPGDPRSPSPDAPPGSIPPGVMPSIPAGALPPGMTPPGTNPPGTNPPATNPPDSSQDQPIVDVPYKGKLTITVRQDVSSDRGDLTYNGSVNLPVIYKIYDDGKQLNLGYSPDPNGSAQLRFSAHGWSTHDACKHTHQDRLNYRVSASGANSSKRITVSGEFVAPATGAPRADALLGTTAKGPFGADCPCGGPPANAPPAIIPLTVDGLRGNVPFRYHAGILGGVPQGIDLLPKLDKKMRAAVTGASLDFDPSDLRAALKKGGRYQKAIHYHYVIDDKTKADMSVVFQLDINFVNGHIQVNPDPPRRADDLTLTANVEGATKWTWTVTPLACPSNGFIDPVSVPAAPPHDGKTWTFKALCDFHVKLHSENDDGNGSDDERDVTLSQRDNFDIEFAPDAGEAKDGIGRIDLNGGGGYGMNRCTDQSDHNMPTDDDGHNHDGWIHGQHDSKPHDYSSFLTTQLVSGDGPFAGYGYIESHQLKIHRIPIRNSQLFSGDFFDGNATCNLTNLTALQQQIITHEHMHSTLAQEWIDDNDPASSLEGFVTQGDAKDLANTLAGLIDGKIGESSSETAVGTALKNLVPGEALLFFPNDANLYDCGALAYQGTRLAPACTVSPKEQAKLSCKKGN